MDIRRGKLPAVVTRSLEVDLTREELLSILSDYLKDSLKSVAIEINTLKGFSSAVETDQGVIAHLEGLTLTGVETIESPWQTVEVKK